MFFEKITQYLGEDAGGKAWLSLAGGFFEIRSIS
jgi:hypothetical protein